MERPLSGMERLMYVGSEALNANPFSCVRIDGPLDVEKLRRCIDQLPRKHPLLAVRVRRKHDALMFTNEGVPPIPLRILHDDGSGQSFLQEIATEVFTPLDRANGPLARLTLILHKEGQVADLILTDDHTIADGTACLYAIRDILSGHASKEIGVDPVPLSPQLAPPSSPTFFSVTSDLVIGGAVLASAPMRELTRRCREHGVTVHAAVCTAFADSFAAQNENKTKVVLSSPISYRHRLDPGLQDTFCCAIGFSRLHVDLSLPTSFWGQARAVRQQILQGVADPGLLNFASMLTEASHAERDDSRFLSWARQSAPYYDFSISNLGRQPIPSRYGELTVTSFYGAAAMPGEIVVDFVTLDETMYITWMTRSIPRQKSDAARRMVAAALSRLGALPA